MAAFIDTEKKKGTKKRKQQTKASLKSVNDYVSRDDKVGKIEEKEIERLLNRADNAIFKYVTQEKKTNIKLITGVNCRPSSVFDEMMFIKNLYNKTNGRQFKHFVHSYHPKEDITSEMAHEISLKLLDHEKFKGFQILAATHVDVGHIHTHYVINSVNMETGLKWQHSTKDLFDITDLSNKLCYEYGLKHSFINTKTNEFTNRESISSGEYRARQKGRSWKYEAWLAINECAKIATSKDEFIENMESLGYQIRWVDERKNITFTLPNGRKLNNDKLHPPKRYTKEALLKRFELNKQFQERTAEHKVQKQAKNLQNLVLETIRRLEDNPELGDRDYPLTYLEGQALKEKMIEQSKGEGLDWEKES
ncbi:relaxase/mobilization nuclease domain-containing protein [Xylanivirga thermophila]|uniref:relaxase/mobilization nuclease domain-containing protein n=1 Tax=Xylanivirga thermophila TaxID=2496273 RepID=UPI00101C5CCE|nr:relaxase/mobilization nuclease domain-containing protein [Xylanivirga thermophila]